MFASSSAIIGHHRTFTWLHSVLNVRLLDLTFNHQLKEITVSLNRTEHTQNGKGQHKMFHPMENI